MSYKEKSIFKDYMCNKVDDTESIVYDLAEKLTNGDFQWNTETIYKIIDKVIDILDEEGYGVCYPYYETKLDDESGKSYACYEAGDCVRCALGESGCPMQNIGT